MCLIKTFNDYLMVIGLLKTHIVQSKMRNDSLSFKIFLPLLTSFILLVSCSSDENLQVVDPTGYTLVWSDEFDGNNLGADWTHEIGTGSNGWGNNELQYYRSENTSVQGGFLTIEAREEAFGGRNYTSSRLITKGKREFKYGRIDIRAKLPKGQGIWPALWMLGANFGSVSWPYCGEIDIMEMIGGSGRENKVIGTLHWDDGGYRCTCGIDHDYVLPQGTFNDDFHIFSIIWDESEITWYVDDIEFVSVTITPQMEEFTKEFFFIFNIAVGGNLPGNPDGTTVFPQQMVIDYIRVYQINS